MMEVTQALQDGEFTKFLNALLGDGVFPGQSSVALQAKSNSALSSQTMQDPYEDSFKWLQGAEGAQQGSQRYPVKSRGTRSNNENKGNKGMRRQVQQLEQYVTQQQEKLRQQLHRNLYLTGRVAILEQFIELRARHERRVAEAREGLPYNPFASWGVSVQEYLSFKPSQVVQKFNHVVQCFAKRLASITPLLQKYPQLITHRPPEHLLQQMVMDLSLAEPTNPHGVDGIPVGSLTVAVPEKVLQTLAAAYHLNLSSMSDADRTMLESCAVLIVEETCVGQTCQHSFMKDNVWHAGAVHLSEVAATPTWEALNSSLSSLRAEHLPNQGNAYGSAHSTMATEAHWKDVAAQLCLTNKQKLEAATACEVILAAMVTVQAHRAQLAHHLLQLSNPSGTSESPKTPSTSTPFAAPDPMLRAQSHPSPLHQQQRQEGVQSSPKKNLRRTSSSESAAAVYTLSSEQLTQQEVLMRRLEHTIAQERSLTALTMSLLWAYILSPVQMAKAVVHSYPYMPRHLDILSACAAECTPAVMDALVVESENGRGI